MPTSNRGSAKRAPTSLPESRAKKRMSAEEIDGWRWTEDGIHQWWQQLKARARLAETRFINDIDFHDLRHDFAIGRGQRAGAWKRWLILWGISLKAGCQPFKPRSGTRK